MTTTERIAHHTKDARPVGWSCVDCGHTLLATSTRELDLALQAHVDYVNRPDNDRATDPHFEDLRLTALVYA